MASQIKLKRSSIPGNTPVFGTEIVEGELALNTADQKLYSANSSATFVLADPSAGGITASSGADNRVAVFSSSSGIEGDANFTWDGTNLNADGGAVFNQSGADVDFRVESNNNANMLFVDGSADAVGIGTNSPVGPLDVTDGSTYRTYVSTAGDLIVQSTSGGDLLQLIDITDIGTANSANPYMEFLYATAFGGSATRLGYIGYGSTSISDLFIRNEDDFGDLRLGTDATDRIYIKNTGEVGIACTSPTVALDVVGDARISDTSPNLILDDTNGTLQGGLVSLIDFRASGSSHGSVGFNTGSGVMRVTNTQGDLYLEADSSDTHGSSDVRFVTDGSTSAVVTSDGLGIGTVSPSGKLDIRATNERAVNIVATESVSDQNSRYEFNLDYNYTMDGTATTANRNKVPFYLDADVNGTVGVGGSGAPADGTRESTYAGFVRTTSTHTAGTMYLLRGLDTVVTHGASANVYSITGTQNYSLHSGTGSLLNVAYGCINLSLKTSTADGGSYTGTATYVRHTEGAGTIGTATAYQGYIDQDSTSTITNGYIYRGWVAGSGTGQGISTAYGLHLDMDNGYTGTIGTAYGVYVADEDRNYFSGSVGIGTTTPDQALDVAGTITTSANVHITGAIRDSGGSFGTSGQVLSSTGSGIDWVDAGSGSGTVTSTNGVNNRVAVFTSGTNIEGDGNFTYNGSTLSLGGSGNVSFDLGSNISTGSATINLGAGRTSSGYAYIDLVGDTTYTDYGLRLIRNNNGANASSALQSRGTGTLGINTIDAAPIQFNTNNSTRMYISSGGNVGIACTNPTATLVVNGSMTKNSGTFKIDHPIKPKTHHLVHSFVEGPQADNIYRGRVNLVNGLATVNIDTESGMSEGTFVALNRDVQCLVSNESGWTAVKGSVSDNILTVIAQDNTCTDTVSWLVIGERQDEHMYESPLTDENGKIIVEPEKT